MTMLILLVEDDPLSVERFEDALQNWNDGHAANHFRVLKAKDVDSAKEQLRTHRFDGAMVDLRIPEGPDDAGHETPEGGNAVLKFILRERAMPIAVISGNLEELDQAIVSMPHIRKFSKGDVGVYTTAVVWLGEQWRMMDIVRRTREKMEQSAAEIFTKRLWPQWDEISKDTETQDVSDIIARQYAYHLAEFLGLDAPESVAWHPYEVYISPSFYTGRAHTGDIFRIDGECWVILSPQCDMATQKIESALLAKCVPGVDQWDELVAVVAGNGAEAQKNKAKSRMRNHINQNVTGKHFLPPLPGTNVPLQVDFGVFQARPLAEINQRLADRVVSIAPAFLVNLTQRFGAHISRTGQPNLEPAHFKPHVIA